MPPFQKKTAETPAIDPDAPISLTFAQLQQLLGAQNANGLDKESLAEIMAKTAELSAEAMRRSLKPENPFHPDISVFSHSQGERDQPKMTLPFELLWLGFPVHKETSVVAWYEMEEYAKLTPGEYTCTLLDRSTLPVTVTADKSLDGSRVTRLVVTFKATRENRERIPSPFIFCYQMNRPERDHRETFVEAMSTLLAVQLQDQQAKESRLVVAS